MSYTYEFWELGWSHKLVSNALPEVVRAIYTTLFNTTNDFKIEDIEAVLLELGYMALIPTETYNIEREKLK